MDIPEIEEGEIMQADLDIPAILEQYQLRIQALTQQLAQAQAQSAVQPTVLPAA